MTDDRRSAPVERPADQPSRYGTFEGFYEAEYERVVRIAVALTGDLHAAEDLAQDGFLKAQGRWTTIASYDDPGAWVRRVVSNAAVSRFRRLLAEARALARLSTQHPGTAFSIPEPDRHLWDAVRRLPRRQAQVVALRFVDDSSVDAIAKLLGCGEATVRTHLRRAKERLAETLAKEGSE